MQDDPPPLGSTRAYVHARNPQYLVDKFHVPDALVPSLTELVALLVFRQARRLVFGYDRRRVVESDLAWREKASVYIPTEQGAAR